jgi:hypothetical protein
MIFHCSSDRVYYEHFFKNFVYSIKKNYLNPKISYNFVGTDLPDNIVTDYFQNDKKNWNEIKTLYKATDREAKGYYALSRWLSIPEENDHVAVCDIDVLAVNKIDKELIDNLLQTYQVINLTRIKPKSSKEGGMMIMILHKDICATIKKFSNSLLIDNKLQWMTDVMVRTFLYENYKVKDLLQMEDISKKENLNSIDKWFVFSKLNKFEKLKNS